MDRNGVWRFCEGSRRPGKAERYCDAPTTVKVKGLRHEREILMVDVISLRMDVNLDGFSRYNLVNLSYIENMGA